MSSASAAEHDDTASLVLGALAVFRLQSRSRAAVTSSMPAVIKLSAMRGDLDARIAQVADIVVVRETPNHFRPQVEAGDRPVADGSSAWIPSTSCSPRRSQM